MDQDPLFDDPSYQRLPREIQASTRDDDDYEDPTELLDSSQERKLPLSTSAGPPPRSPPPLLPPVAEEDDIGKSLRDSEVNEALLCNGSTPPYRPLSSVHFKAGNSQSSPIPPSTGVIEEDFESDTSSGEEEPGVSRKFTQVRQSTKSTSDGTEDDEKLYLVGDLVENAAPFSFKSGIILNRTDSGGSLEEQGIYQGLVMTDAEKQRLGILPESIYMTANLEQWGDELEHMSVRLNTTGSTEASAASYQVPQVTFPRDTPPRVSPQTTLQTIVRPIGPKYRGSILRPPPLPPMDEGVSRAARKAYSVVENLLKSEAAFLTSLNIAIESYMNPLTELAQGPSPILDRDQVEHLFGPITQIVRHHELFYMALTTRTMAWTATEKIGDIFLSSFNRKEVIKHYSLYVNNFTTAMQILEKAIKKKAKFVTFLRRKYNQSKTSLSLQGLLLKPIQRFPQYILFLQDLLRFTHTTHPDKIHLQMALARFEGIADYLNESKRQVEQRSIVEHLNNKVTGLPFKLVDSRRWLHRQDVVTRLMFSQGRLVQKKRSLLLFNNMVLCASLKHKSKKGEMESSKDFQVCEGDSYSCKWFSPLSKVEAVETDYHHDIWDYIVARDDSEEAVTYRSLKAQHKKLEHDFITMTKITGLLSTLTKNYQGLSLRVLENHIRVLQRELASTKEEIKQCQAGRVDLVIPSRDDSGQFHHTYMFQSEKVKRDWLNTLRCAKLQMKEANKDAWVYAEEEEIDDEDGEDYVQFPKKLPLLVDEFPLMASDALSVECATKVGSNGAWFASGNSSSAQVTVVQCMTHCPLILECFMVNSARIMAILCVPASPFSTSTLSQQNTLGHYSSDMMTVWMGTQCGKILIYNASIESSKVCISTEQFNDSITAMEYHEDQVFVANAEGSLLLFQRLISGGWDLTQYKTFTICKSTITSMCMVGKRLWLAIGNQCYIFNMKTHKIEDKLTMSNGNTVSIKKMTCWGAGVWVSFRGKSSLELYHSATRQSLQQVDIKGTLVQLINKYNLEPKLSNLDTLHITALMASSGYLWVGTSIGALLVYNMPHLEGVPLVTGKPYLAMDAHREAVRVLLTVKTMATVSSTRVSQFIYDEQARNIGFLKHIPVFGDGGLADAPESTLPRILEEEEIPSNGGTLMHSIISTDVEEPHPQSPTPPLIQFSSEETDNVEGGERDGSTLAVDKENQSMPWVSVTVQGGNQLQDSAEVSLLHLSGKEIGHVINRLDKTVDKEDEPQAPTDEGERRVKLENGDKSQQQQQSQVSMATVSLNDPHHKEMAAGYSYPTELDTFRRLSTPESVAGLSSHDYDPVTDESSFEMTKAPSPYEDPNTLEHTGPIPAPEFFAPIDSTMSSVPGKPTQSHEEAVYVLTAGRGLLNLRAGRRKSSVLPIGGNSSLTSVRNEGCMIAYEIF